MTAQVSRADLARLLYERGLNERLAKTPRGAPPRPESHPISARFRSILREIKHELNEAGDIVPSSR